MAILNNSQAAAEKPDKKTMNEQMKEKRNGTTIVLFVLFIVIIGLGILFTIQKGVVTSAQADLDSQIANLKTEIGVMKNDKIQASQTAVDTLKKIEKDELKWSNIISAVQELLPYDSIAKKTKINFLSYSGNSEGKLTLSAATNESALPPYSDVSQLIQVFNNSNFFKDAYVPSISKGTTATGNTTLSFVFNVTYQEPDLNETDSSLPDVINPATSTPNTETTETKIPRVAVPTTASTSNN